MLNKPFLISQHLTGTESATINIEPVTDVEGYMENVGCCEKCGATESEHWYIRKWLNNGLPDYQGICHICAFPPLPAVKSSG